MKIKRILALLLMLAMVFALAACGEQSTGSNTGAAETGNDSAAEAGSDSAASEPTVVNIGCTGSVYLGDFDPTNYNSGEPAAVAQCYCFQELLYQDKDTKEWASNLLSDWSFDEQTLTLELTLMDGARFTLSGEEATGEDLFWSLERTSQAAPNLSRYAMFDFENSTFDDHSVSIKLDYATSGWTGLLAQAYLMNKSWVEDHGGESFDYYDYTLIDGTGPYLATDFIIDTYFQATLSEDWWGYEAGVPAEFYGTFDQINCYAYTDENTMMVDYENGVIDAALKLSNTQVERIQAQPELGVVGLVNSGAVCVMNFDIEDEYTSNKDLRAAICYAIDTAEIAEIGFGQLATPAQSSLSSVSPYSVGGLVYEYDLEKAQEYLDASGVNPADVELKMVVISGAVGADMGEAVQYMLSQIGLTVDLQVLDFSTVLQLWETEGSDNLHFDQDKVTNIGALFSEQYNRMLSTNSFYATATTDEQFNTLMTDAMGTTDEAELTDKVAEIQQFIYDNYFLLPLCEWSNAYVYNSDKIPEGQNAWLENAFNLT